MRTLGWAMMSVCVLAGCRGNPALGEPESDNPSTVLVSALDAADSQVDLSVMMGDGHVAAERSLFVAGGDMTMASLSLPVGTYGVAVRVSTMSGDAVGTAQQTVAVGEAGPMFVKVILGGERPIRIVADHPPRIDTVEVFSDAQGRVHLGATTRDADGDHVIVHWSASASDPAVPPGDTITLDDDQVARSNGVVHLVAEDEAGAFAVERVLFKPQGTCAVCGSHSVHDVNLPIDGAPCAAAQIACIAHCDLPVPRGEEAAGARCYDGCAVALALCIVGS